MNKLARYIIIIAVVAIVCFLAWYFSDVLAYILIAVVVSIIGKPLVNLLTKVKIKNKALPRALCAGVALLVVWCVFLAFFFFLVPAGVSLVNQLSELDILQTITNMGHMVDEAQAWITKHIPGITEGFSLRDTIANELTKIFNNTMLINAFGSVTNTIVNFAIGAFAVSFIAFFFLKEDDLFTQGVLLLFPARYEKDATAALTSVTQLLTRYFVGIFIEMFCLMILVTAGLTFVAGLPFKIAVVLGLLSGIMNVIPYIGSIVSSLIGIVIGLLVNSHGVSSAELLPMAIVMALVYIVAQTIDVIVLQPVIYSKSIRSHPLEIFIVLLIAGSIGGIFGMLVAIPAYTVVRVFAKQFFNQFRLVQKLTQRM